MGQVLQNGFDEWLHDLVIPHAAQQAQRAATDVFVRVYEIVTDRVTRRGYEKPLCHDIPNENHLLLQFTIVLDFVTYFPVQRLELLNAMVIACDDESDDCHKQFRITVAINHK